jgi:hypothetical protein
MQHANLRRTSAGAYLNLFLLAIGTEHSSISRDILLCSVPIAGSSFVGVEGPEMTCLTETSKDRWRWTCLQMLLA